MTQELSFFDFKRKHSLSHSDIQKITNCTLDTSREWTKGAPVPHHITQMLKGVDIVIDQIKTEQGIFTNSDAQHAAHIIEGLNIKLANLESELAIFRGRTGNTKQQNGAHISSGPLIRASISAEALALFPTIPTKRA